ncbi:MAG: BT4734/BF3469 family protein [Sphingobacteriaceae bacterium]
MKKFSFYKKGITNKMPSLEMDVAQAIAIIRSEKYKEVIDRLRNSSDIHIRSVIKKNLDYFTFSGRFKKRLTENLIEHSGIICLDFDDIDPEEYFKYICEQPFALACFRSPSGKGLKVLVKIQPNLHRQSFLALGQFFETASLVVDQSGKDVTRACFVSHDPNAYLNLDSHLFTFDASIQENAKTLSSTEQVIDWEEKKTTGSHEFERLKNLKRVLFCVEQIEASKIDITDNDYDDRLMVGFALSTLGDDARELYHRAVQYNDAYEEKDADTKFNDALKTTKFKTPAKFFALCKNHGIKISLPKTISEAKAEADYSQIIGDENNTKDYLTFGIWESSGSYWSLDLKGKKVNISNFKMRILYHVETNEEEAFRLIEIKNIYGHSEVVKMNTDDFVSVASFKKVVARKGNFIFKGGEADLCRLQDKLQREERPTKLVKQLGWHKNGKFYAFANGIFDININQLIPIDEYGIVEHYLTDANGNKQSQNFFIPALSKVFADKEDMFSNYKKFIYQPPQIDFATWAKQYALVYNKQGHFGIVFYIMSIFSDIIFRDMGKRFPLLFVYGKRGTGKGTLIASLMRMFGDGQDQIMLGGASTVVGFMRKLSQFVNGLVWMDEYKNNLLAKVIESLKNIFDRIGYERGKKDNTFNTESTPIHSACVVSGQEMPTIENAFFTRCILVSLKETNFTENQREEFRKLQALEAKGLSGITVQLLRHRDLFEQQFKTVFEAEQKKLIKAVNNNEVDDRLFMNYAALIATAELIATQEVLPFNLAEFKEGVKQNLLNQFSVLTGSDDASKFWDVVEHLFNSYKLVEDTHFILKDGYLFIRVQDIYHDYAKTLQERRDPNMLDKATLEKYLESDDKTFVARVRKYMGGKRSWCFQFKYAALGIDLIRNENAHDLKAKYAEMGVLCEEEDIPEKKLDFSPF